MAKVGKLKAARYKLATSHPYLATAVWAFQLIEKDMSKLDLVVGEDEDGKQEVITRNFAVDERWRLYYDPVRIEEYHVEKLVTVLLHEVNHLIRAHAERARTKSAQPLIWNLAADAEINDDLREEGCKGMEGLFFPEYVPAEEGLLAEQYYDMLVKDCAGAQQQIKGPGAGACGSAAHGQREDYEEPTGDGAPSEGEGEGGEGEGDAKGGGDGESAPTGISPIESKFLRRRIAKEVQQHEKSHGIGSVPQHYRRWADAELEPPQVAWQQLLSGAVRRAIEYVRGLVDYTYSRPSRRSAAFPRRNGHKLIMPSMHKPVPDVAVVIDTSGSMGGDQIRLALSETDGILKAAGATTIRVMSCDADVHTDRRVRSLNEIELGGGGGTNMGAALEALAANKTTTPHIAVVLTDGYTPWPDTKPPFETVVCVINGTTKGIPPWAQWVQIGEENEW